MSARKEAVRGAAAGNASVREIRFRADCIERVVNAMVANVRARRLTIALQQ